MNEWIDIFQSLAIIGIAISVMLNSRNIRKLVDTIYTRRLERHI